MESPHRSPYFSFATVLILVALVWRVSKAHIPALAEWSGFSPLMAIVVIGAVVLPARRSLWVVVGLLVVGDMISYGGEWLKTFPLQLLLVACFVGAGILGLKLRDRVGLVGLFGALVVSSVAFYVITNTACWVMDPGYGKNLAGWMQSLTVGKPGFLPTWMFLRNSLAADLVFGLALVAVFNTQGAFSRTGLGFRGSACSPWGTGCSVCGIPGLRWWD